MPVSRTTDALDSLLTNGRGVMRINEAALSASLTRGWEPACSTAVISRYPGLTGWILSYKLEGWKSLPRNAAVDAILPEANVSKSQLSPFQSSQGVLHTVSLRGSHPDLAGFKRQESDDTRYGCHDSSNLSALH